MDSHTASTNCIQISDPLISGRYPRSLIVAPANIKIGISVPQTVFSEVHFNRERNALVRMFVWMLHGDTPVLLVRGNGGVTTLKDAGDG